MKKFLIANWKENPVTEREAMALFETTARVKRAKNVEVGVCPPFVYLEKIGERLRRKHPSSPPLAVPAEASARRRGKGRDATLVLGAQDAFWENEGPHTGEVGPKMLKQFGVRYVIVGHSERRALGEMDATVCKKVQAVLKEGLKVILCVGESASVRRGGLVAAKKFVKRQLVQDLGAIRSPLSALRLSVAYEPIWAIGTGRNCPASDAALMAQFIKQETLKIFGPRSRLVPVLYGGSVSARNIFDYVQYREIDGALVGGASLKADEFKKMIQICDFME